MGRDEEPVHLLLVEDDPLFAELLQAQLRRTRWVDGWLLADTEARLYALTAVATPV